MNLITLNKILNVVASAGVMCAGAIAAGQVPPKLLPWAGGVAALGSIAAKIAKTPSQSMAAAAPAPAPQDPPK